MTCYGYIIMIIVDSCKIRFNLDCIMQLKKSYYIASNVCSRKSAITFGDLPDCTGDASTTSERSTILLPAKVQFILNVWR